VSSRQAKSAETSSPDGTGKQSLPLWQEVIVLLTTALVLAVVVKAFFVQAFFVPSGSMEPQFVQGDRILVEKVSYWNNDVRRGDVIVFDDPGGWLGPLDSREATGIPQRGLEAIGLYPTGGHLVKRVIGVGGDRVVCCDGGGRVTVNGVRLKESDYLKKGVSPSEQTFDVKVPADALWVMGDNRFESGDSRVHLGDPGGGFVPGDAVVGKVWSIVWPLNRLEILDRPAIYDAQPLDRP
jgi:signal peptidase I